MTERTIACPECGARISLELIAGRDASSKGSGRVEVRWRHTGEDHTIENKLASGERLPRAFVTACRIPKIVR